METIVKPGHLLGTACSFLRPPQDVVISRPAEVIEHSRLLVTPEGLEQPAEVFESLRPDFGQDLALNPPRRLPVSFEIFDRTRSERHRLLPSAGRRGLDRHVSAVTEAGHDLGGALARDFQLAPDLGDRRLSGSRADAQHASVGEATIFEAGGGHLLVEPALVPDPGLPQAAAETNPIGRLAGLVRAWFGNYPAHDKAKAPIDNCG